MLHAEQSSAGLAALVAAGFLVLAVGRPIIARPEQVSAPTDEQHDGGDHHPFDDALLLLDVHGRTVGQPGGVVTFRPSESPLGIGLAGIVESPQDRSRVPACEMVNDSSKSLPGPGRARRSSTPTILMGTQRSIIGEVAFQVMASSGMTSRYSFLRSASMEWRR